MKSLHIKNYKNLQDFRLDTLSRVNLFVGKNNTGKSSLLEAISIYCSKGDVYQLKKVLDFRGEGVNFRSDAENPTEKEMDCFVSLYSDRNLELFFTSPIEIEVDLEKPIDLFDDLSILSLSLVKLIESVEIDSLGMEKRVRSIVGEKDAEGYADRNLSYGLLSTFEKKTALYTFGRTIVSRVVDAAIPFEYIRTSQISSERNPLLFDRLALTPLEKEIIKALQIIEPRIDAINFLKDEKRRSMAEDRVPIVVFQGSTQRYKLTTMGDGINRILTIVLALLNAKDGALLIDEFENGLHYSVQNKLWQMIYQLAEELNVQVFATTHSNDCVKSFVESDANQQGKLFRLENVEGCVKAVAFNDKERVEFAIDQNIEIR